MKDFKSLSDRMAAKILSLVHIHEGVDLVARQNELVTGVTTTVVKDAFGHLYEVQVKLIGRTFEDREELK